MIIQYTTGKWDKERMYKFSLVRSGQITRFEITTGYLADFDRGYNYNVVIE